MNSKKQISRQNTDAIDRAISKGAKVVVCSGRIYSGARAFAKQLNISGPIISCNGAMIVDLATEKVIYSNYMDKADCQRIIDICHEYGIYFHVYIGDTLYTENLEYSSLFYWNKNKDLPPSEKVDIRLVENLKDIINKSGESILKIVAISDNSKLLLDCRRKVSHIGTISVTSSDIKNFEVMNFGVNKGSAMKIVAERLKVPINQTIAIGDNENDLHMFESAGLKFAMGNAEECVKEKADFVTFSNDENGVAYVLNEYVK